MGDCETLRPRLGAFDPKHRLRRGLLLLAVALGLGHDVARAANTGATWSEVAKWPDFEGGLWTAPNSDGHPGPDELPLNQPGKDRIREFGRRFAAAEIGGSCAPRGMPLHLGNQFIYSKGMIVIEGAPDYYMVRRHVYMDGKPHDDVDLGYFGKSIGHWENDTLVIDTSGFLPEAWLTYGLPGDGKTHIVERYRLIGAGRLELRLRVENSELLTRPYTTTRVYTLQAGEDTPEAYCTNNRDFAGHTDLGVPQ